MQTTTHAAPGRGRIVGLFLAIVLQIGFVWAIMAGLTIQGVIDHVDPFRWVDVKPIPKTPPPPPTRPFEQQPDRVFVPIPDLPPIANEGGEPKFVFTDPHVTPQGPADHGPFGIAATHSIPPYPAIEARLGHQGTVLLRLTINAQGVVIGAEVVRTSGYEALDEAARAWVMAHWRYQPAIRGGAAVPATGTVAVRFDLRNAG